MAGSDQEHEEPLDAEAAVRLRRVGGDRLLQRMIDLFLDNAPGRMDAARTGARAGDLAAVERAAHSLKGSAGNLGARTLQREAERLEIRAAARDGRGVVAALRAVEGALAAVEARLRGDRESLQR